jgi:hypothetical protein
MPFFDPIRIGSSGATDTTYSVDRSLRFSKSDSMYLERTPSSTGNQKVWTWSAWFKRTKLHDVGGTVYLFSCNNVSGNDGIAGLYMQNDEIYTYFDTSGSNPYGSVNGRKFRDLSAWMHIVWQVDAANTSQRIWINGEELSLNSGNNPPDFSYGMNQSGIKMFVGRDGDWGSAHSNFYFAEIHYSDGNKYEASDFAETNSETGAWVPKSPSITYGTNGYYLNFSDNSGTTATTMGKDSSGNGNNFTPVNLSTYHSVPDSPTNNFCTINPIDKSTDSRLTVNEGMLKVGTSHGFRTARATFGLSSGKWYWEARLITWSDSFIGITDTQEDITSTTRGGETSNSAMIRQNNGDIRTGGSNSSYGNSQANGDILGFALDMDNGKFYISENGTFYNSGDPVNGTNAAKTGLTGTVSPSASPYDNRSCLFNFGQDDTFDGNETSQGNTDANGLGVFKYAPPTGFLAICSANLNPTIQLPTNEFDTKLWTGNGGTQTITGLNFSPDFVWIKIRTQAYNHVLWDTLRGVYIRLQANQTTADGTNTNGLTAFNSDGYTLGDMNNVNKNGDTFVGWNWNAGTDGKTYAVTVVSDSGNKYRFDGFGTSAVTLNLAEGGTYVFDWSDSSAQSHPIRFSTTSDGTHGGGSEYTTGVVKDDSAYKTTITVPASAPTLYYYCQYHSGMGGQVNTNTTLGSSNFDGSRHVTTKANALAGFSIIKYTGTGSTATIGHGLGVAPEFMFVKTRDSADHWALYHHEVGNTKVVYMNIINAPASSSAYWNNTSPTSSVFTVGSDNKTNKSGDDYIAYCFSGVEGYSKFGEYEGNGNSDGTFINLGFKPAFFMFRQVTYSDNWYIYDNKRDTMNPTDQELNPSNSQSEASSHDIDFLSNGVKMRTNNSSWNYNGYKYIYLAFAELPFKNARAK